MIVEELKKQYYYEDTFCKVLLAVVFQMVNTILGNCFALARFATMHTLRCMLCDDRDFLLRTRVQGY